MRALVSVVVALFVFGGVLSGLTEVRADYVETLDARLPIALRGASAVWDGTRLFIFGGKGHDPVGYDAQEQYYDYITEFDPSMNTTRLLDVRLPVGLAWTSAIYDGQYAYIFGGHDGSKTYDTILRFDPKTKTVSTLSARLPAPTYLSSAVWDGSRAYVVGGTDRTIARFDPLTGSVAATSVEWALHVQTAIWDGRSVLIFDATTQSVLRYKPTVDTIEKTNTTIPAEYFSSVWDPGLGEALLFGSGNVFRYNAFSDQITRMRAHSPPVGSAVWSDGGVFLFGGYRGSYEPTDHILRYRLTPGEPRNVVAHAGPGPGNISIAWAIPPPDTYTHFDGFRVYASELADFRTMTQVAEVQGNLSFTDTGLPSGATRFYRVATFNQAGEGGLSDAAVATTFSPPGPPAWTAVNASFDGRVFLAWDPPQGDGGLPITSFLMQRLGEAGELVRIDVGLNESYEDHGLANGTYFYNVSAVNAAGEGVPSGIRVRIPPESVEPGGLPASAEDRNSEGPASKLVLTLEDFPAGWTMLEDQPSAPGSEIGQGQARPAVGGGEWMGPSSTEEGFVDGHLRGFLWLDRSRYLDVSHVSVQTWAYVFNTTDNAARYYASELAEAQQAHSTERKRCGDDAVFWAFAQLERMQIRKDNVVWGLRRSEEGFPSGNGVSIEKAAEWLVAKAGSGSCKLSVTSAVPAPGFAAVALTIITACLGRRWLGRRGPGQRG